jgi:hypothetical protein
LEIPPAIILEAHHFRLQRDPDRRFLAVGKREAGSCLNPGDRLLGINCFPRHRSPEKDAQALSDPALGMIEAGKEDALAPLNLIGDHIYRFKLETQASPEVPALARQRL